MTAPPSSGSWWATLPGVLTGAAAVITAITGLAALFWPRSEVAPPLAQPPAVVQQQEADEQSPVAPSQAPGHALPKVTLAAAGSVSFSRPQSATYTVLDLRTGRGVIGHHELRIRVRYVSHDDRGKDLGAGNFRLLVDGVPRSAESPMNLLIHPRSAKEGELTFDLPVNAKTLSLQVLHSAKEGHVAEIPMRVVHEAPVRSR